MDTSTTASRSPSQINDDVELFDPFNAEKTSLEDMLAFFTDILKTENKTAMRVLSACNEVNELTIELTKLFNTVEAVQTHMEFTLKVLRTETEEQIADLKQKFSSIIDEYRHIESKDDITHVPAKTGVTFVYSKIFSEFQSVLKSCFTRGYNGEAKLVKSDENIGRVEIIAGKFEAVREHYPLMVALKNDDIFRLEKSSEVWQDLYDSTIFKQINTKDQVAETSKRIHFLFRMSNVVIKRCVEHKCSLSLGLIVNVAKDLLYYGFQQNEAETQMLLHLLRIKAEEAFIVWNLPEQPFISSFLSLRHYYVGCDQQIFIPRLFPKITKELIYQEYQDNTFNKIHPMDKRLIAAPNLNGNREDIIKDLFTPAEDRVAVRILSSEPLNLKGDGLFSFGGLKHRVKKTVQRKTVNDDTAIVIHIHGGGFVSMSSLTHKVYLARWVKNLKLVHFSIDYRLAPHSQYPDPLDDVWQAYLWILNYSETVLGIKTPKIILTGDSAGGNLGLCLSLRLIRAGLQPPHGLLMIYPALAVDAKSYSPSYFLSIEDTMLPYSLMKFAAKAYTGDGFRNSEDPFISPIAASDELLEKLPPVTIIAAAEDPLNDDNWRFMAKMRRLKLNAKMIMHENLSHGYLFHEELANYNVFIEEACDEIRQLISNQ